MSDKAPFKRRPQPGRRPDSPPNRKPPLAPDEPYYLFGLHAVEAALANPARRKLHLKISRNAAAKLAPLPEGLPTEEVSPRDLDKMLGRDVVHQGAALFVEPIGSASLKSLMPQLVLVLDQVTDPHNVGAILRTAAAFGADAIIATTRHAASETGTLAKAASGALELVPIVTVRNLANALEELGDMGVLRVGLAGDAGDTLEDAVEKGRPTALVLGSEGKGLRQRTRETCDVLARIDLPGALHSLNVSNAAALALYVTARAVRAPSS